MNKLNKLTHPSFPGIKWNPFVDKEDGKLVLAYEGQRSIDWPLRLMESKTIQFDNDWMDKKYPIDWQSLALATMALASHHIFITISEQWQNLFAMLGAINDTRNRTIPVPADITYVRAIERANRHGGKFNLSNHVNIAADPARAKSPTVHAKTTLTSTKLPWLPRNIFIGLGVHNILQAETTSMVLLRARRFFPEARFMIYQDGLDAVDWEKLGLRRGTVDWIVCNSPNIVAWEYLAAYGRRSGTPVLLNEVTDATPLGISQEVPDISGVLV